jgi:hypothetical protein
MTTQTLPPIGRATYQFLMGMGRDAGNASMRKAGRSAWNDDDRMATQARFEQLAALYALPGETWQDGASRLIDAARGSWYEGTCPA